MSLVLTRPTLCGKISLVSVSAELDVLLGHVQLSRAKVTFARPYRSISDLVGGHRKKGSIFTGLQF